jgi:NAD(P)-dependent dehydrogenase (short-subunit alcohol dehydrogenase family)
MPRVLITGSARRIGAALARALAADGWHVVAHYHRSAGEAQALAAEITAAGGACDTIQADLAERAGIAALIPRCVQRFGKLDALINNASSFRYDTLQTMDDASWQSHLGPNLEAPVFLAQAFAAALEGRPGNIINMLDHKVTALNPDFFSYTIAKIAAAGATRLLAQALGPQGVRVNGIAPGITLLSGKQTEAGFRRAWSAPPLGRSSTPEELAAVCQFILATPSLNGQILVLDGGDSLLARPRDIAFESPRPHG